MKGWSRKVTLGLFFALILFMIPINQTWGQGGASNDNPPGPQDCESLRTQMRETCRLSAKHCVDVFEYDAFNQIQACAHYAQECQLTGLRVEEVCFPGKDAGLTVKHPES